MQRIFNSFEDYQKRLFKFNEICLAKGLTLGRIPIKDCMYNNQQLFLDFAFSKKIDSKKVFVNIAGTHGVEGFIGNDIQIDILKNFESLNPNQNYLFIFCLNPHGLINLKRFNHQNIDLNRNGLKDHLEKTLAPASKTVKIFDSLLRSRNSIQFYTYLIPSLISTLIFGSEKTATSIAGGQVRDPNLPFYGGKKTSDELLALLNIFKAEFNHVKSFSIIEIHSGLGPWKSESLILENDTPENDQKQLAQKLQAKFVLPGITKGTYSAQGTVAHFLKRELPHFEFFHITQEFGTLHFLSVLKALVLGRSDLMLDAFYPLSTSWRKYCVVQGRKRMEQLCK